MLCLGFLLCVVLSCFYVFCCLAIPHFFVCFVFFFLPHACRCLHLALIAKKNQKTKNKKTRRNLDSWKSIGPQPPTHSRLPAHLWTIWKRNECQYYWNHYMLWCLLYSSLAFCLSSLYQQDKEHHCGTQEAWVQRAVLCWTSLSQSEKINKSTLGIVFGTILWPREAIWTGQQLQTQGEQL